MNFISSVEIKFSDEELSQKIYLYEKNFFNDDITILDKINLYQIKLF